jgi:hypothetical protein
MSSQLCEMYPKIFSNLIATKELLCLPIKSEIGRQTKEAMDRASYWKEVSAKKSTKV